MSHKMFSKTLLIFLFVNLVSDSYGQRAKKFFRSDYTYIESQESFYKIHLIPLTWAEAEQVCALEGATFWHPDNDDEAHAVISFWDKMKPKINWMYVGLSNLLTKGIFQTVDGKPVTEVYRTWAQNEPNNAGGIEYCVQIDKEGFLNDCECDKLYNYVCKKSLKLLEWNDKCNIPNLDYSFSKDTGKCYKLHTTPSEWREASAMCEREQTSLAMINSRLEAYFLAKLTESAPTPSFKDNHQRGIFHLGFQNILNHGWQTVKRTPINVDDDVWYDNYQPEGRGQCGAMFYTGRLINIDCNMRSLFICENDPDKIISPAILSTLQVSEQPAILPYVSRTIE